MLIIIKRCGFLQIAKSYSYFEIARLKGHSQIYIVKEGVRVRELTAGDAKDTAGAAETTMHYNVKWGRESW